MIRTSTILHIFLALALLVGSIQCSKNSDSPEAPVAPKLEYKTQNVVIVMIDGPRYADTWGDPTHSLIPKRSALLKDGVLCSSIYNMGTTSTVPGHIAITTG